MSNQVERDVKDAAYQVVLDILDTAPGYLEISEVIDEYYDEYRDDDAFLKAVYDTAASELTQIFTAWAERK